MPEPEDLPGTGWEVVAEDEFGDGGWPEGLTTECQAVADAIDNVAADAGEPLGKAQREIHRRSSADAIPLQVNVSVGIYETDSVVERGYWDMQSLIDRADFLDCLGEVLTRANSDAEPGATFDFQGDPASVAAPRNGIEYAAEGGAAVEGRRIAMRLEFFGWQVGNAQVAVSVWGPPDDFTASFVRSVLREIDLAVANAASEESGAD
jgi:hypothetical protein